MKDKSITQTASIGIIILAAGASRRMGTPKQLLKIDNQTLIERAIDITQALDNQETVVVLGANAAKISPYIQQKQVTVIINKDWAQGMGTTLKAGLEFFLAKEQTFEAIIVMVCDQPYLTTNKLQQLMDVYQQTEAAIIATEYNGIKGVPALFGRTLFSKLLELNKDEGARKIIKKYKGKIVAIDFPEGIIDLDTPAAYQAFLEKWEKE